MMMMINKHDIEDLCPDYYKSKEEILYDDRAYWYDIELQGLKLPEVWGKYILGENVKSYEFNLSKGYYG
jgi:hypothetical protein